jgi:galactose mutarotase-like enzyme
LAGGRLLIEQTVDNPDTQPLPFSTGIHPYLRVPLANPGDRAHCHLRMPRCVRYNPIGKWESFFTEPVAAQTWPVARDISGTLLLGDFAEKEFALVDPDAGCEVVVNFADSPEYRFAAIWSRSVESPFYCVEPWTALPNSFGRPDGELIILPSGGRFSARLWLDIRPARS